MMMVMMMKMIIIIMIIIKRVPKTVIVVVVEEDEHLKPTKSSLWHAEYTASAAKPSSWSSRGGTVWN